MNKKEIIFKLRLEKIIFKIKQIFQIFSYQIYLILNWELRMKSEIHLQNLQKINKIGNKLKKNHLKNLKFLAYLLINHPQNHRNNLLKKFKLKKLK